MEIEAGVSIGIACFPEHAESGEQLLRASDQAMYQAKRWRGHYQIYDPSLDNLQGGSNGSDVS